MTFAPKLRTIAVSAVNSLRLTPRSSGAPTAGPMNTRHQFSLEKAIWDDADFATMGWHDATLWSMLADPYSFEVLVDIDYIFEWVRPAEGEAHFKFWVAPATMVFENAADLKINIESSQGSIEIANLHRQTIGPTPNGRLEQSAYRFECQEGEIALRATGFKLYVRQPPVLLNVQSLVLKSRGGVSFSREMNGA